MLIDPDFLDHWRTIALVDALDGDEMAPMYLIRLWGHCQTRKTDTFEIPTKGLRSLCRYSGDAERLETALTEAGWIERDGGNIRAIKWLDHNRGLSKAWENGQRGGRPKKPDANRTETGCKPDANRKQTGCEPDANRMQTGRKPIGLDRTGQDEIELHASTREKSKTVPPLIQETPEPAEPPELSPVIAAISAWGAGTVGGSAASRLALVLDTLARQHPIADPATGTDADPQAVCLALVADLRSKPDTPGPSEVSRVRAYADAVLQTCAAQGRLPGSHTDTRKTRKTTAERREEGNYDYDLDHAISTLLVKV